MKDLIIELEDRIIALEKRVDALEKRKKRKPNPVAKELHTLWLTLYKKDSGVDHYPQWAREIGYIKKLLTNFSPEQVEDLIQTYFTVEWRKSFENFMKSQTIDTLVSRLKQDA